MRIRSGAWLGAVAAMAGLSACTSILGGFDYDGKAGSGGGPSSSSSGTGGSSSSSSTSSSSTSSSTSSTSSSSGGCTVNMTQACYDGPAGTRNVGNCKDGQQTCDGSGAWGTCMSAVKPMTEDCTKVGDEDCDGFACSETIWAALYGDDAGQSVRATASDAMGNVYLVGQLDGSIVFGSTTLVASGSQDIYVAKLDKDGHPVWAKQFNVPMGQSIPFGIGVDGTGAVIVAGHFTSSLNVLGKMLTTSAQEIFVAKLDASGAPVWANAYGTAAGNDDVFGLAVDAAGNIALAGAFYDKLDFGCGTMTAPSTGAGYIAKLDKDGKCVFNTMPTTTLQFVQMNGVAIDVSGNVVAVGDGYNGMGDDMLAIRYDGVGNLTWSQQFGSMMLDAQAKGVAVDSTGSVYVSGLFQGTLSFFTDPSKNLISMGSYDVALIKLKATTGVPLWTKRFGDSSLQAGSRVAVDKLDDVVITGTFGGSISFGGATYTETFSSSDAFLAKFKSDGSFLWSRAYGGSLADALPSVSVCPDNTIIFTETAYGPTIDLGTGTLTVAGSSDAAIAKIAP